MHHYPPSIRQVIRLLSRLPGIGEKSAERMTMHLLRSSKADVERLLQGIQEMKDRIRLCRQCFGLSDAELCPICSDPARDAARLCVVEQPADMASIEKSGAFRGLYHILQGALSPMDGIGPESLRIRELIERVRQGAIEELILATGTSVEGEATADYLAQQLKPLTVHITRIATGVPAGGDLKFIDQVTLRRALEGRHVVGKPNA